MGIACRLSPNRRGDRALGNVSNLIALASNPLSRLLMCLGRDGSDSSPILRSSDSQKEPSWVWNTQTKFTAEMADGSEGGRLLNFKVAEVTVSSNVEQTSLVGNIALVGRDIDVLKQKENHDVVPSAIQWMWNQRHTFDFANKRFTMGVLPASLILQPNKSICTMFINEKQSPVAKVIACLVTNKKIRRNVCSHGLQGAHWRDERWKELHPAIAGYVKQRIAKKLCSHWTLSDEGRSVEICKGNVHLVGRVAEAVTEGDAILWRDVVSGKQRLTIVTPTSYKIASVPFNADSDTIAEIAQQLRTDFPEVNDSCSETTDSS